MSVGSLLFCLYLLRDAELLTPLLRKIIVGVLAAVVLFPIGANSRNTICRMKRISSKTPHCPRRACTKKAGAQPATFSPHPSKQKQAHSFRPIFFLHQKPVLPKDVIRISISSGTNPPIISHLSITSGIVSQSSICRKSTASNPLNGAVAATTQRFSSTA